MQENMSNEELKEMAALVAEQVVRKLNGMRGSIVETEFVDTEEAARILGVSPNYLRSKKDKYPHVKAGDKKQGRIMFRRDSLLNEFRRD